MTREEQLDWLCRLRSEIYVYMPKEWLIPMNDALDMTIKALSQEPCDDAISRKAVLDIFGYVMDYWKEHAIDVEPHEIKDALIEQYEFTAKQLNELPSVTQKTIECDDAISREDVEECKELMTDINRDTVYAVRMSDIRQLPSVTQKSGKWIPFSERLPKPFENCLITTTDGEVIYHYDDGHYSKYKAWMPLPEPYEPQESEE
ncbi:MAG: hypothetical protein J6S67_12730 [Methanobrevibacter sp.]|nr:hypothetical protein [Methanobrevibacter sp.]